MGATALFEYQWYQHTAPSSTKRSSKLLQPFALWDSEALVIDATAQGTIEVNLGGLPVTTYYVGIAADRYVQHSGPIVTQQSKRQMSNSKQSKSCFVATAACMAHH